ncbi:hypothetical protein [Kitasatospora sp. NPDC085879]|uniref:hypothetical protein n=1 Tax=Kitasatospora sp. NPDC085879 TaxID=3154769 RepID=UPI003442BB4F
MTLAPMPGAYAATTPRIDLRLLVVDDGGPAVGAIVAELDSTGVPYTRIDLASAGRQTIAAGFLSDTVNGAPRAKFQAVVMPSESPAGLSAAELTALASYEQQFGIRQVDAYTYAGANVGLNWGTLPGAYAGTLDGVQAQVTAAGKSGPFGYLEGGIAFEDNSPSVSESYGYLATPLAQQAAGATFTPYVDAPIPGTGTRGSLVGEYAHDGRRELVVTFVYNAYQRQYRELARGIVEWATEGIHLGYDRNYFALHVDDVFMSDDRWDTTLKCTPGDVTCPPGSNPEEHPSRMTVADAEYLKQWQASHDFKVDLAYNGGGSEDFKADGDGTDPLAAKLIADQSAYRWINHTYTHQFLGCVQDVTVVPWRCTTNASGQTVWTSQADITSQITNNRTWAANNGLTAADPTELVTGEHSGLVTNPQQPTDNPYLAPSLNNTGVRWTASDSSREHDQRAVGNALTVPRYPLNVFYNAAKTVEEVDEYNWIYTSRAQGGSGICEDNPATSTCLPTPLDLNTGYGDYIVPLEARLAVNRAINNDPRPHFVHQSNYAEDRIAYPVMERILAEYDGLYASNTPLVNLRQKDIGTELQRRAQWKNAVDAGQVTAYRVGDTITVSAPSGVLAEATMPGGTKQQQLIGTTNFGSAYAGQLSGWVGPGLAQSSVTLKLAGSEVPISAGLKTVKTIIATTVASLPVPKGVKTPVPAGPAANGTTLNKLTAKSTTAKSTTAKSSTAKGTAGSTAKAATAAPRSTRAGTRSTRNIL